MNVTTNLAALNRQTTTGSPNMSAAVVFSDRPTMPDPEGRLNSHGDVAHVRVCSCPKVVETFDSMAEALDFAATVPDCAEDSEGRFGNHLVVVPVRAC